MIFVSKNIKNIFNCENIHLWMLDSVNFFNNYIKRFCLVNYERVDLIYNFKSMPTKSLLNLLSRNKDQ